MLKWLILYYTWPLSQIVDLFSSLLEICLCECVTILRQKVGDIVDDVIIRSLIIRPSIIVEFQELRQFFTVKDALMRVKVAYGAYILHVFFLNICLDVVKRTSFIASILPCIRDDISWCVDHFSVHSKGVSRKVLHLLEIVANVLISTIKVIKALRSEVLAAFVKTFVFSVEWLNIFHLLSFVRASCGMSTEGHDSLWITVMVAPEWIKG